MPLDFATFGKGLVAVLPASPQNTLSLQIHDKPLVPKPFSEHVTRSGFQSPQCHVAGKY